MALQHCRNILTWFFLVPPNIHGQGRQGTSRYQTAMHKHCTCRCAMALAVSNVQPRLRTGKLQEAMQQPIALLTLAASDSVRHTALAAVSAES